MRWPLAWQLLAREWRAGEIGLLASALILGVALVAGIGLFADRLEKALTGEASQFMGADRILRAAEPLPETVLDQVKQHGLDIATTVTFPTMIYPPLTGDEAIDSQAASSLASIKAVDGNYPLLGKLIVRDQNGQRLEFDHGPATGEVWVDENVLNQLNTTLGEPLEIGSKTFIARYSIIQEADTSNNFYGMGSRALLPMDALSQAQLISAGSRVEYRYLLAGSKDALSAFEQAVKPLLPPDARLLRLENNQRGIAGALDKAKQFLQLAGSLGVLLAALAGAFAAQCFCERQTDVVATLKTLGATRARIQQLIISQLLLLWLTATAIGLLIGCGLQWGMLTLAKPWLPAELPAASSWPWLQAMLTSLFCIVFFILPAFFQLAQTAPWRIFRAAQKTQWHNLSHLLIAGVGVLALLMLYSQNFRLIGGLVAGILALTLLLGVLSQSLLQVFNRIASRAKPHWSLASKQLLRERWLSNLQLVVFSLCFMLLGVMILLRGSLLEQWQRSIPADAPNVFLMNVAPTDVERLQTSLQAANFAVQDLFPMARARLTHIDDLPVSELRKRDDERAEHNTMRREVNLSWAANPQADNMLTAGEWPAKQTLPDGVLPVSVEDEVARDLQLQLGSRLTFRAGSQEVVAQITSLRKVNWDKMSPNFYFLFEPGAIEQLPATYITSFYREPEQQAQLTQLLRQFPDITALPVDQILSRIQAITERATLAVEAILWLVLLAGLLVLISCIKASMPKRLHTAALLRTLGASRQLLLGSQRVEFIALGVISGLLAAFAAQLTALALQQFVFKTDLALHPWLWFALPLVAASLIAAIGVYCCRPAVKISPLAILRLGRG